MLKYITILLLLITYTYAQEISNLRRKTFYIQHNDTIKIDTLSIIPGTVVIFTDSGLIKENNEFKINYITASIIINKEIAKKFKDLDISYRVYPYNFSKEFKHKELKNEENKEGAKIIYEKKTKEKQDILDIKGIEKKGTIQRGISLGNKQDVIVNSSMNLQLRGDLGNNIKIAAAITDNNIPVQPEGNTHQLQEFDKVYIELSKDEALLKAGDFDLKSNNIYFMKYYKKAQGLNSYLKIPLNKKNKDKNLAVKASAALSKGKYAKNNIDVIEGVQGPYKLKGNENESYIVIIAGSEKVYIDGQLLKRGLDNDYIIDYNMSELSFTVKNVITKDIRIYVEFQYTDKKYSRTLFQTGILYTDKKLKLGFNFYSEQDLKNQPIQQRLNTKDKLLLATIGDSIDKAYIKKIDRVAFSTDEILYSKTDTLVNSILYDSVFIYSTNPLKAHYRLGFSKVGEGRGNYIQVTTMGNGRVYKWLAPVNGIKQGAYEPYILLVSPKKAQMYDINAEYKLGKNTIVSYEMAISNKDLNTFSKINNEDNIGKAFRLRLTNTVLFNGDSIKRWKLNSQLDYEYKDELFRAVENYKAIEFERDWNIINKDEEVEQLPSLNLRLFNQGKGFFNYNVSSLFKGTNDRALRNSFDLDLGKKKNNIKYHCSFLLTDYVSGKSNFLRQNAMLSKNFKFLTAGALAEMESNKLKSITFDSLQSGSASFYEYGFFVKKADSIADINVYFKKRDDYLPVENEFKISSEARNFGAEITALKQDNNRLYINFNYRLLDLKDTTLLKTKDLSENTASGRLEYFTKQLKGALVNTTFYEAATGMEAKKEYSYFKVADGKGVYTWKDYNNNNIPELNEFEMAAFKDEAAYLRIWTPTDAYMKTYTNQFNEAINLNPSLLWKEKNIVKLIISTISASSVLNIDRKTSAKRTMFAYNLFNINEQDDELSSLVFNSRNTIYFNRNNPKFAAELSYNERNNKINLVNGFETTGRIERSLKFRWNIVKQLMYNNQINTGNKSSSAIQYSGRNFSIKYYDLSDGLTYQPDNNLRLALNYRYADKKALYDSKNEICFINNPSFEIRYSRVGKVSFSARFNYLNIKYSGTSNSALAFDMLEGLNKGDNYVWNINYQRSIGVYLQLSLTYEGRQSAGNKTIHTGTMQLRASF
ncbi:MAG: hypothetical protein KA792_03840 [Bacteroidales bacterium]|nr:hypothetical protein [Bacteroidales bacterium]